MPILLRDCRISYPNLFHPVEGSQTKPGEEPDLRYRTRLYIGDENSENYKKLVAARAEAAKAKWGDRAEAVLKKLIQNNTTRMINFDDDKNSFYINATRKPKFGKPRVVNAANQELTEENSNIFGGCWVNASVEAYAYDYKGNRGVACGLRGIQFLREGEPFGRKEDLGEDFEAIETVDVANEQEPEFF